LPSNHDIQIVTIVITVCASIIFFELFPEKSIWSTPAKQEEEHNLVIPASWAFNVSQRQKQKEGERAETKEQEYWDKQTRRTRILIVDNERDITSIFKKALRNKGFEQVDTFNEPILALKNFKAGSYDLIIIDIVMPEMDGFRMYEEIRKMDTKVKVCFITAYDVNYQALRAIFPAATTTDDTGCFIRKPIDVDDFIKHIEAELR
jgi:CheY-like chemotaxis protein